MNERHIKLCASMLNHALFADHTQERRASEVKSALQFFFTDAEIECARADVSGKPRPAQETPAVQGSMHTVTCKCGATVSSPITGNAMNLNYMAGWYFSTETNWLCPRCAPSTANRRQEHE